jgi:hypothetical protein
MHHHHVIALAQMRHEHYQRAAAAAATAADRPPVWRRLPAPLRRLRHRTAPAHGARVAVTRSR